MALIPGETHTASGTGMWTTQIPANVSIAIDNPTPGVIPPDGTLADSSNAATFPTVKLLVDVKSVDSTAIARSMWSMTLAMP